MRHAYYFKRFKTFHTIFRTLFFHLFDIMRFWLRFTDLVMEISTVWPFLLQQIIRKINRKLISNLIRKEILATSQTEFCLTNNEILIKRLPFSSRKHWSFDNLLDGFYCICTHSESFEKKNKYDVLIQYYGSLFDPDR